MANLPGGEFKKILNTDLEKVTVVSQCLDNQWVPRELLSSMFRRGRSLRDAKVIDARLDAVRAEYLRSLLNAEQVVVNRAFFVNNQAVYRDFEKRGVAREAFKKLLKDSVVVPYLYRETSLVDPQEFSVLSDGERVWHEVVEEVEGGSCLRLSWDDEENRRQTNLLLSRSFHDQLLRAASFESANLQRDFTLDRDSALGLKAKLREVAIWAAHQESPTREDFYREFVVAEGSHPADGQYDRSKEFSGELKQLADLKYGVTLSDALDRYPLTPADSLDRTALQELDRAVGQGPTVSTDTFLHAVRQHAFTLAQRPLNVSLSGLGLEHVVEARGTDEWLRYKQDLLLLLAEPTDLLARPEEFAARSQAVYDDYVLLAGQLSRLVGGRREDLVSVWQPVIKLSIHALGATISIVFHSDPYMEVVGRVADSVASRASRAVVRFAVVGRDQRRAGKQLDTSVDLMKIGFQRTRDEWNDLVRRLQEAGFFLREPQQRPEGDATLNAPEDD